MVFTAGDVKLYNTSGTSASSSSSATYWSAPTISGSTVSVPPWTKWVSQSCSAVTQSAWTVWIGNAGDAYQSPHQAVFNAAPAIISVETRARLRAEEAGWNRTVKELAAKETTARQKARALLLSNLTAEQRDSLETRNFFDVKIEGRLYRIRQGTHGNVRLVEADKEVVSFCAQPNGVPIEDAMLSQKLMLETDEQAFLRIANAHRL